MGALLLLAACALGLSGCSPANRNALTREDGLPAVYNCGGWIDEVAVRDADTGRLVWMARATATADGYEDFSTGKLRLGQLPSDGWTQIGEYAPDPTPTTWDFLVDGGREHLVGADVDLVEGRYLYEGKSLTYDEFRNDVCDDDGGPLFDLFKLLVVFIAVLCLVALVGVVTWAVVWHRRNGARPVGWHQRGGVWRWWNGTGWQ